MTVPDRDAALALRDVWKSFDRPAVRGLDLSVRAGEFYALLGPNGAGKTTTLRMVAGLLRPDRGAISIFGIDARRDPVAAKRVVAWVSDEPMIYDKLTPLEYLEFVAGLWGIEPGARRTPRRRADRLARPWPARQRALRGLLQGHAPEGGARRRARPRPAPDHPRRAADRPRRRLRPAGEGRCCCERVAAGCTIIMTTHILEVAERMAERIGVIAAGRADRRGHAGGAARPRRPRGRASRRSSSTSSPKPATEASRRERRSATSLWFAAPRAAPRLARLRGDDDRRPARRGARAVLVIVLRCSRRVMHFIAYGIVGPIAQLAARPRDAGRRHRHRASCPGR